jgi:hypothetical protein
MIFPSEAVEGVEHYSFLCKKRNCRHAISAAFNTVFSLFALPLSILLQLTFHFFYGHTSREAALESSTSLSSVHRWWHVLSLFTLHWLKKNQEKIGGEGKVVEVDEAIVRRRKYKKGRKKKEMWVVGGIERGAGGKGRAFIEVVKDRTKETLEGVIVRNVERGTKIYTDCWAGYNGLEAAGFPHRTVNHSTNYVNPEDPDVHTQHIENLWSVLRRYWKFRGTQATLLETRISTFLFHRRFGLDFRRIFIELSRFSLRDYAETDRMEEELRRREEEVEEEEKDATKLAKDLLGPGLSEVEKEELRRKEEEDQKRKEEQRRKEEEELRDVPQFDDDEEEDEDDDAGAADDVGADDDGAAAEVDAADGVDADDDGVAADAAGAADDAGAEDDAGAVEDEGAADVGSYEPTREWKESEAELDEARAREDKQREIRQARRRHVYQWDLMGGAEEEALTYNRRGREPEEEETDTSEYEEGSDSTQETEDEDPGNRLRRGRTLAACPPGLQRHKEIVLGRLEARRLDAAAKRKRIVQHYEDQKKKEEAVREKKEIEADETDDESVMEEGRKKGKQAKKKVKAKQKIQAKKGGTQKKKRVSAKRGKA